MEILLYETTTAPVKEPEVAPAEPTTKPGKPNTSPNDDPWKIPSPSVQPKPKA
jgi:hypothetical protein